MKRILILLLLLSGYSVFAQNNYVGKNDPEARSILKKVTNKYKSYKTFSSDFSLIVENGQGQKVGEKTGSLASKGNKFYIQMDGDASFSDGSNIYNYDKGAKEMQITKVNPNDNTITPQKLFTDFYEKDFLYKLNDEVKKGGKIIEQIELTPMDKTQPYFKIILEVDKISSAITGAKIFEKNGNKYIYTIKSFHPNVALADSKFNFSKSDYPGVEVIDLR